MSELGDQATIDRLRAICAAAEPTWRALWSEWPKYHCTVTCLLLAPVIRAAGYSCHVVLGNVYLRPRYGPGRDLVAHLHCWIVVEAARPGDGWELVVDPTFAQFSPGPAFVTWAKPTQIYRPSAILDDAREDDARRSITLTTYGDHTSGGSCLKAQMASLNDA